MILDFAKVSPPARYQWMTQAVIPRPIAWVLSENDGGDYNLAPFSYFNALASEPALLGVSIGVQPDGGDKDTLVNIRRHRYFVVHIADLSLLDALNDSSATMPYGVSEVAALRLPLTDFIESYPLPRLQPARVALACRLERQVALSDSQTLVIGEILYLYADDAVMSEDAKNRPLIDAGKVNPLARLSAGQYAGLSDVIVKKRPA